MKSVAIAVVGCLMAGLTFGAEVVDSLVIDGHEYHSVKWGPVNQGKVVIFHNRGAATIPLEKLPPEYQAQFGYKPATAGKPAATPELTQAPDWAAYNKDRATK